jgi:uncharacterized protein (UPF0332 family)
MKFDIKYLLKEGLLRIIPSSKQKAEESIRTSEKWLKESENNFKNQSFMSSVLTSYLVMFHAARAILFLDGFREKSHFAVARYLEDKYCSRGFLEKKWINLLDHYREFREQDQYSTCFIVSEKEAKNALNFSQDFMGRIKGLLKNKLQNI